ncbi:uncharacterized protein CLAFUR5_13233 [Fulvia fulva]|uniref:Transcription factor domain-containing protein n=1 Tax=Passalora fulva TaxID=5499 RepID=A0A9Q8PK78_PASFU|nr:uncharacterized protein CLAFUR5_13233 [Fulvia fulva]KAK4613202.1 hypothetical protein CLAFUR0_13390 [Fulvia fulva]UJO23945.1 hypothetical protein CLAFUR5_13233 [Fulvia fulva]
METMNSSSWKNAKLTRTETEERRRLWWAVIILDRCTHAGFRFRPLAIPSIAFDEIIPASHDDWDNGELAVNPLLVMSIESETLVSPYARACQAAHLLGRVCQHFNDHTNAEDCDIHFREAVQILRAEKALNVLVQQDALNNSQTLRLVSARALCISALLLLTDVHSCIEVDHVEAGGGNRGLRLELQQMAIDEAKATASETVSFAEELEAHITMHGVASVGPLVLNCLYPAAATFAWYHRETGSEAHYLKLLKLRHVLGLLKEQWPARSDYLDLLEGTGFTYTGAAFQ